MELVVRGLRLRCDTLSYYLVRSGPVHFNANSIPFFPIKILVYSHTFGPVDSHLSGNIYARSQFQSVLVQAKSSRSSDLYTNMYVQDESLILFLPLLLMLP